MATTNGETLTELERRAETTRAELAHTVDELHSRVSPEALKADVRGYARDTSQHLLQRIEAEVRDNPLQAAAITAMVAYPLWKMAAKIPVPLLMIGAGVALSRRSGGHDGVYEAEPYSGSMTDSGGTGSSISDAASGISGQITEKAQETMERVRSFASEKVSDASDLLSRTYREGRETASSSMQHAGETYGRTRDTLTDMIERHPVMAGGIAFAVGTLLAASLPVTRQENRMMGSASDDIKRRTQDLASEGLEQAEEVAQKIYRSAAEQVSEEGLTPEGARTATRAAMKTAREAVEQTASNASRPNRSNT
jgi:ElaB/YqjD/DUF883 family membrane-anchored ribosome-binding protein